MENKNLSREEVIRIVMEYMMSLPDSESREEFIDLLSLYWCPECGQCSYYNRCHCWMDEYS